jgi:uncharacterized protein YjbJ (UPF0337 family)
MLRNAVRAAAVSFLNFTPMENYMDKDRIEGAGNQVKGSIKQAAGKVLGDTKLQAEGTADKLKGKVQNAVGGAKDAVRDAADRASKE